MPAPSTTQSGAQTHCPVCGAKKTRPDSSICAYCASPFELVGAQPAAEEEDPLRARLAKMEEHAAYAEAVSWKPLEGREFRRGERAKKRGLLLVAVSLLGFGLGLATGAWTAYAAGGAIAALGLALFVRGSARQSRALRLPLLKRPALVQDRRSETELGWWKGDTLYFFALDFGDGSAGEFRWRGRGVEHDPLVKGATGVAHTRGDELLGFRSIRV